MKRTSKLLSLLLLLALAATCQARVVYLEVNELPKPSAQDIENRTKTAILRRFLELHPSIRISRGTRLQIEGRTMDVVPLMQIAGDVSPHVIYVNFRFSDTYIQKGFLKPLDEYIAQMPKEELDRRVPPALRNVCYRYGPDGEKHWYCLPTSKLVRVLAYRKDLFARAGLDPEQPPRTWTELSRCARQLTDHEQGRYGLCFVKGDGASWDFANLVWSNGGEIVVMKNGKWRPSFNTPEVVDALYYYAKLNLVRIRDGKGRVRRGVAYRDTLPAVVDPLDTHAMSFTYLDERLNVYQPEMIGYAPVPHPDNAKHGSSEINAMMLGVFSGTTDPEVACAAYEYIAFLDSDEANRIRARMYIQRGYGRFLNPDLLRRFGYTDYLRQVDKEWVRVYHDALVNGKPEPYGRNCSLIWTELSRPVEQAINDSRVISAIDAGDVRAAKRRLKEILGQAQAETERRMYGIVPPEVASFRRATASVFLALACLGFAAAVLYLIRVFRREAPAQTPGQRRTLFAYGLILPAFAGIVVWQYLPLLRGTVISFQDYSVVGRSPFVGVANFATVLFEPNFWHSMSVTLKYTALYMLCGFIAPIVLALFLAEVPRGKVLFRTLFYLPAVLSGLVVVFLWKSFYKPNGLLNSALGVFGIELNINWLDSPTLAMLAVMLPVIWAGMGPGSLIYIAALKTIPEDLYEAADIDGAGVIKKITCITLPGLKMLIMINAIGAFIGAFMTSEMILAMTGGGPFTPYGSTEVVGLQLFYTAFMYLKFGVANAMAWVLGFILLGFTLMQLKNLSRVEFKGGK